MYKLTHNNRIWKIAHRWNIFDPRVFQDIINCWCLFSEGKYEKQYFFDKNIEIQDISILSTKETLKKRQTFKIILTIGTLDNNVYSICILICHNIYLSQN